jgi:hypothetical protein
MTVAPTFAASLNTFEFLQQTKTQQEASNVVDGPSDRWKHGQCCGGCSSVGACFGSRCMLTKDHKHNLDSLSVWRVISAGMGWPAF